MRINTSSNKIFRTSKLPRTSQQETEPTGKSFFVDNMTFQGRLNSYILYIYIYILVIDFYEEEVHSQMEKK